MNLIETFRKAIHYIDSNLDKNLSLNSIASEVFLSPFYFDRLFHIYAGIPVSEYIKNRKMSEAGKSLHFNKKASIIDTAFDYGYSSQESFSKAFKRFHGVTPKQAKSGAKLFYTPPLEIVVIIKGGNTMDYKIEKEKEFAIVVLVKSFSNADSQTQIPLFWDDYIAKGYQKDVPPMFGVCFQQTSKNEFDYGIGSIEKCVKKIPVGFKTIKVPAQTWAKFYVHGPMPKAIQDLWCQVYKEWLPNSDYEVVPGFDFECYDEGDTSSPDYRSGIWIAVKKK